VRVHVLDRARSRPDVGALVTAVRGAGHDVTLLRPPAVVAPAGALLRARAIDEDVLAVPFARRALRASDGVAHAFTLGGAYAAAREHRPLVLSLSQPVRRETVADRRLRLTFLKAALDAAGAITAPDELTADSAARWLGVRPHVLDPACDGSRFVALYEKVQATR
jgi:hypothetical protein